MGQISKFLRSVENGYTHWCPGCEEMHRISYGWTFNGNPDIPTFFPSVKIEGKKTVRINGRWTGDWIRNQKGEPVDYCCHYFLRDGKLDYQKDSTHRFAGQIIPSTKTS